jgi:hypothetical protein
MEEKKAYIWAVDFDGTLCVDAYPNIGEANGVLIEFLRLRKMRGDQLILWTCRSGVQLSEAVAWCREQGLAFDAVNENLPERIKQWENDCRKVYADFYVDDKSLWCDFMEKIMPMRRKKHE